MLIQQHHGHPPKDIPLPGGCHQSRLEAGKMKHRKTSYVASKCLVNNKGSNEWEKIATNRKEKLYIMTAQILTNSR